LYAEVTKQLDAYTASGDDGDGDDDDDENGTSNHLLALAKSERIISSVQDVCELLEPWTASDEWLNKEAARLERRKKNQAVSKTNNEKNEETTTPTKEEEEEEPSNNSNKKSPPFLWGTLPVGPVLARRLAASERSEPTSVQRAAFRILTEGLGKGNTNKRNRNKNAPVKKTNAIIASPTGTGKTLAYLLPLLCTSPGGQGGEGTGGVLIVTPTIELACQIQREVDVLWPPTASGGTDTSGQSLSSIFVVGAKDEDSSNGDDDDDDDDDDESFINPGRIILRSIANAPLIAGTPKMLRMLYQEAGRIANGEYDYDDVTNEERTTSKSLLRNLRAIVLDEADRLLRTEAVARETTERKARKMQQRRAEQASEPPPSKKKGKRLVNVARQTQTELLLRDLPIPSLLDVQIICASATIGRTMRRQLMQILDAPSADAAATLVTGDEDERVKSKDAERRKSVLLPEKLQHAYRVVDTKEEDENDDVAGSNSEGVPTQIMSKSERNEEKRVKDTVRALWDTMASMKEEAKPIIIFPGRVGVERVQSELMARGLEDVRTLRNLDGLSPDTDIVVELDKMPSPTTNNKDHMNKWSSIPVYIIGERFARGLDLPNVEYVFMLSPPSSAAGYAHMAGRTGRVGRVGTAITLVRPKNNEVQRLAAIAEALGLKFAESMSGVAGGEKIGHGDSAVVVQEEAKNDSPSDEQDIGHNDEQDLVVSNYPWELLSESAIGKKKNAVLYEYLVSFGDKTVNKRSKKAELVSAIQLLHSKK